MTKLSRAILCITNAARIADRPERRRVPVPVKAKSTHSFRKGSGSERAQEHPLFAESQSGHGRVENRAILRFSIETLWKLIFRTQALGRSCVARHDKENRSQQHRITLLPLSSTRPTLQVLPVLQLIRGHWAGVEIRNHWRRDALMGEDQSRSRNPNLLANLAIIRVPCCAVWPSNSRIALSQKRERLHSNPSRCFALITSL